METEVILHELRNIRSQNLNEHRVYRLTQAWLAILRDAYHCNNKQFSDQQVEFLKQVSASLVHLRRFIEIQEELEDSIGLEEYNDGLKELQFLDAKLADTAVSKRIKKEVRQLMERKTGSDLIRAVQKKNQNHEPDPHT